MGNKYSTFTACDFQAQIQANKEVIDGLIYMIEVAQKAHDLLKREIHELHVNQQGSSSVPIIAVSYQQLMDKLFLEYGTTSFMSVYGTACLNEKTLTSKAKKSVMLNFAKFDMLRVR